MSLFYPHHFVEGATSHSISKYYMPNKRTAGVLANYNPSVVKKHHRAPKYASRAVWPPSSSASASSSFQMYDIPMEYTGM